MSTDTLIRGFDDNVHDSQQCFRQILRAMSEPGTLVQLCSPTTPEGLAPASFALCQTLLDSDTRLWLSPGFDRPGIERNLRFHCGLSLTRQREEAHFALARQDELQTLEGFGRGSPEYPETGVTLLLEVSLEGPRSSHCLTLSGPGIDGERQIHVSGLTGPVLDELLNRQDSFPQGIDLMLIDQHQLICIPRTTRVSSCLSTAATEVR